MKGKEIYHLTYTSQVLWGRGFEACAECGGCGCLVLISSVRQEDDNV